jgi:hypothetical protein
LWRDYPVQVRAVRISRMAKLAVRYREYPMVSLWGGLINVSGLALPSLFLAQYYGAQNTGWFALLNRVLGVPAALIGLSIAQVYASEAAKLSRSDPDRLIYIFLKTTRRMLYLGLAPCVLFTILAPWIFQIIFGHAWREAGEYARYLAFMFYASFINSPVRATEVHRALRNRRIRFYRHLIELAALANGIQFKHSRLALCIHFLLERLRLQQGRCLSITAGKLINRPCAECL